MLSMTESEYMMEEAFFNAVSFDELTENLFEIYDIFMNDHQETFKVDSQEFFNSITDWLKGNLAESISLQNVCSHFGISQTYLSKMFRKYTEQSFSRYFTELRMRKAMKLMREQPELFIKDIAVMVGYTDQFYFSRIFRSVEGVSPMEYMKQNLMDVLLPN
jgi:two-component system response regulator YesN